MCLVVNHSCFFLYFTIIIHREWVGYTVILYIFACLGCLGNDFALYISYAVSISRCSFWQTNFRMISTENVDYVIARDTMVLKWSGVWDFWQNSVSIAKRFPLWCILKRSFSRWMDKQSAGFWIWLCLWRRRVSYCTAPLKLLAKNVKLVMTERK